MLTTAFLVLILIVLLAWAFDFINGFHDTANAIATVVSTKVLSPRTAVIMAAVMNFLGALIGTEVAATIGKGIVNQASVTMATVAMALTGAIIWNLITWYKGLPTSSSHTLIGSLMGATYFSASGGVEAISWDGVTGKVVIPMFSSPMIGIMLGFIIMGILTWVVFQWSVLRVNAVFGRLQIFSASVMALSHGHNDAQKSMGIIALALIAYNPSAEFTVPIWVILSCGIMMGLGTMMGGWRIIRTMGTKMIQLQPVHGFAAETSAATIIMAASHYGIPLSTTHVISTSIMGVGIAKRFSSVRWKIVTSIVCAWILTIPFTFLISGALMFFYQAIVE